MIPEHAGRNYRAFIWHALFLSITVTFTEINTVIPALILQIGGSEIHVGIVSAIMIGIPLVSRLNFAAFLSHKSRKKPAMIIGITLRVLSLFLISMTLLSYRRFTFTQLLLMLYAELTLFTLSGAFAGIAYVDLIGNSFNREMRKRFFTRKQIISSVGILLSAAIARQIMQAVGYPKNYIILFFAASGVLLVASAGFWGIRENPSVPKARMGYIQTIRSVPALLKSDRNLRMYLLYLNAIGTHVALIPFYAVFAQRRYYLDAGLAGNMMFIQIVGMITASLIWPRLVKIGGFKIILRAGAVLAILLPIGALVVGYTAPLIWYLVLYGCVGVTVSAKKITEDSVIVELSTPENRILYSAVAGTLNITVIALPLLLGFLISWLGFIPIFIGVSLISLVALISTKAIVCPVDSIPVSHTV
jgi:MFS family permease